MEIRTLKLSAPVPATPEEVIQVARLFKDAATACAESGTAGQITLKVDNYEMKVTASGRDAAANAALSRLEDFAEHPKKASLSEAGRTVLKLLHSGLRAKGPGVHIVGQRNLTLDEKYWATVETALGEPAPTPTFTERTTVDAVVSGVRSAKGKSLVQLHIRGRAHEFETDVDVRTEALRLFDEHVYATVEFENSGGERRARSLLRLRKLTAGGNIVAEFALARSRLAKRGVRVVTSEWPDGEA